MSEYLTDEQLDAIQARADAATEGPWAPITRAVEEGERRALYEWQIEHREPCDECEWREVHVTSPFRADPIITHRSLDPCPRHGGPSRPGGGEHE